MDENRRHRLSRRQFLRMASAMTAGIAGLGALATGCSPQAPAAPAPTAPAPAGQAPAAKPTAAPSPAAQAPAAKPAAATAATFCVGTDMSSADPHADNSQQANNIKRHMYETLVERDDNLNLAPLLATSWKRLDKTTWQFKLREGVKFHNGQPFTAADVKFSLERIVDKNNNLQVRSFIATVDHVDIVDPSTVNIVTVEPDPVLPARAGYGGVAMMPNEAFKAQGKDFFARNIIGTGPYKFVEWVKDDRVTMEANADYWGTKARITRLTHKPILESSTRVAALRTGAVDLIANVEPQQIKEIEGDQKLSVVRTRNARIFFIVMNSFRKPFDSVKVRQALNYAVDVDAIIKDLWEGHAFRTPSVLGQDWFGYDPDQKPYAYDPAKAKQLLAEAGYPNGFEVTINTPKGRYLLDAETTQAVAGYLQKVGVNAKVEVMEYGNFIAKALDTKNADNRLTMFYIGYGTPILDADDVMSGYLDSKRRGLYYNDPKLDDMIRKGLAVDTDPERKAVYKELVAHVKDVAPWIFLFNGEDIYGVNKRITGWKARPDEYILLSKAGVS